MRTSELNCPHEAWGRQRLEAQEAGDFEQSAQCLDRIAASHCLSPVGMLVQLACLMDLLDYHNRVDDCPVRQILGSLEAGLRSLIS